ncbi:Uncharacterised protein [uncultured archaeon]|nr:Uncharacterised protein [uncultured archaeon]
MRKAVLLVLALFVASALIPAVSASDAFTAYRSNTGTNTLASPKIRFWNSTTSSWGSEVELAATVSGSNVQFAIIKSSPVSSKLVLVTEQADGTIDGYVCMANCTVATSWTAAAIGAVWSGGGAQDQRRFDVEFERKTGTAVVVYGIVSTNAAQDLAYMVLPENGTTFTGVPEQYINDAGHNNDIQYEWVRMDANPLNSSQELIVTGYDVNDHDINAWVWNGAAWGNAQSITDAATSTGDYEALAVKYTTDGTQGMVMGGDGGSGSVATYFWTGATWTNSPDFDVDSGDGNDVQWINLKADPASNTKLQAVLIDSGSDLHTAYYDGTYWNLISNIDAGVDVNTRRPGDVEWEPTGSVGWLVWDTDTTGTTQSTRYCNPQCGGATTLISTYAGRGRYTTLYRNPTSSDAVRVLGERVNDNTVTGSFYRNDTAWTNYGDNAISTDITSTTWESYSISFRRDWRQPSLQFVDITPASGITNTTTNWVYVNVTSSEELQKAYLEWNGVNTTMYGASLNWYYNMSGLGNGSYSYKVYGEDIAGFWNVTGTNTIIILDQQAPTYTNVVELLYGAASTEVHRNETLNLSAAWADNFKLVYAWLETNESGSWANKSSYLSPMAISGISNISNFMWSNSTFLPGRFISWRINANDTGANVNRTPIYNFTVWGWANTSTVLWAGTVLNRNPVNVSCKVLDSVSGAGLSNYVVSVYNGSALIASGSTDAQGWFNTTYTPVYQGASNIFCNVTDNASQFYNKTGNSFVALQINESYKVNVTVFGQDNAVFNNATVTFTNAGGYTVREGNGSVTAYLIPNATYDIAIRAVTTTSGILYARMFTFNATSEGIYMPAQVVENYAGNLLSGIQNITPVFALNDTGIAYNRSRITLVKDGVLITRIMRCASWNYSSGLCVGNNWEANVTSDYGMESNSTHVWFNVTSMQAYAGAARTPAPNLTQIKVYDLKGYSNTHTDGILIDSGLNKTFTLNGGKQYRFEFYVNNTGDTNWIIDTSDIVHFNGTNNTWAVNYTNDVWYNDSSLIYTGGSGLNGGNVTWNTTLDGSVPAYSTAVFYVVINISGTANYSVTFLANDTSSVNGSTQDASWLRVSQEPVNPLYSNVVQLLNGAAATILHRNETMNLSSNWRDDMNMSAAMLETNESGLWVNKTSYGSPMALTGYNNISSFLWANSTFVPGRSIGWRINANDTEGNANSTPIDSFTIWGWANTSTALNVSSVLAHYPVSVYCRVFDTQDGTGLSDYVVNVSNGSTIFSSGATNANGWYNVTYVPPVNGTTTISCLINDNTSQFYNAISNSSKQLEVNATYITNLTAYLSGTTISTNTTITFINDANQNVSQENGSLQTYLKANFLYEIDTRSVTTNSGIQYANIYKYNVTADHYITTQLIETYAGTLPQTIQNFSAILAINDTGLTYNTTKIVLAKNGLTITRILQCPTWNYSSSLCLNNNWIINAPTTLNAEENTTHIWFNTTNIQAYTLGEGKPIPNITNIRMYDLTGLTNYQTGGLLQDEGLNKTFGLYSNTIYRFEFYLNNTGDTNWTIDTADLIYYSGLNASWPINYSGQVWYNDTVNTHTTGSGSGNVTWNTTLGGTVQPAGLPTFYFVVNITSTGAYPVVFFANNSETNSGSTDASRLSVTQRPSPSAPNMVVAYTSSTGTSGTSSPKIKFRNDTDATIFDPEIELPTAGSPVRYVIIKYSPVSGKMVLISESDDGWLDAYVCLANCRQTSSWTVTNNIGRVWTTAAAERRFDFEFEPATGDLVLVYGVIDLDTTHDIAYKVLPDASTSFPGITEQYIDDTGHASNIQYSWIRMDRKPLNNTEELVLVGYDSTDSNVNAWVWSGSAWGNNQEITADASSTGGYEAIAVRYAADASKAMVIAGDGASGNVATYYWASNAWTNSADFDIDGTANDAQWINLKADPATDDMQAVIVDSASALHTSYWDGSAWTVTSQVDTGLDVNAERDADFEWEPTGSVGMLVWDTDTTGTTLSLRRCAPQCTGTIITNSTYAARGRYITMYSNPDPTSPIKIIGARLNSNVDLGLFRWNTTEFTNYGDAVMTADATSDVYEGYSVAFPRDKRPPAISYVNITPENNTLLTDQNWVYINITSNEELATARIEWAGTNGTMSGTNTNWHINKTSIADGTYTYKVFGNDTAGYWNSTDRRTVTIDTTGPTWTNNRTSPPSGSTYTPGQNYTFNVTWTDATTAVDKVYIEENFTGTFQNITLTSSGNNVYNYTFQHLKAGTYSWRMYANDTAHHWTQTPFFTYTVAKAQATINLTLNGAANNISICPTQMANISAGLIAPPSGYLELYNDSVLINNGTSLPLENRTNYTDVGRHNITAYYPETENYTNTSTTFWVFSLDCQAPTYSNVMQLLYGIQSNIVHRNETMNLSANWADNFNLSYATLETNESTGGQWMNQTGYGSPMAITGTSAQSSFIWTVDSALPPGTVVGWRLHTNDTAGNVNTTTPIQTFTIWGYSNITWTTPVGLNYTPGTIIPLVCQVADTDYEDLINGYAVNFYVKNTTTVTFLGTNTSNTTGHAHFNWNTTNWSSGLYNVSCNITGDSNVYYNSTATNQGWANITLTSEAITGVITGHMNLPPELSLTNVGQNKTFTVNVTVTCAGDCGSVTGALRYNVSSIEPDTNVLTSSTTPMYILTETNPQSCSNNPLVDTNCTLTWTVNATGDLLSTWNLDTKLTATKAAQNETNNSAIKINIVLILNLSTPSIDWGILDPQTTCAPAPTNLTVTVDPNSNDADALWIRGDNLTTTPTNGYVIPIYNVTWCKCGNCGLGTRTNETYEELLRPAPAGVSTNVTFWIDVPAVPYDHYTSQIYIMANTTSP